MKLHHLTILLLSLLLCVCARMLQESRSEEKLALEVAEKSLATAKYWYNVQIQTVAHYEAHNPNPEQ